MIDIKIEDLRVEKKFVKYLSLAWNGDIEIHLGDPTKGDHKEESKKWENFWGKYDKSEIGNVSIGNHNFEEVIFQCSCDGEPMISTKTEGTVKIVLMPRNGKALDMEIGKLSIPKDFVKIIKFRENKIQIRLEQPDLDHHDHKKLSELISLSEFHENKIIDGVKLGNHLFENQGFLFTSNPKIGIEEVKRGSLEINLQ